MTAGSGPTRGIGGLDERAIVVQPSGWFVVSALLSPGALLALGGWGLARAGEVAVLPAGLFVAGAVLGVIVLIDLPVRSELGPAGVLRVCPLRRHLVAWDDVMAVSRTRVDRGAQRLVGRVVTGGGSRRRGGLVLEVGPKRRKYLLTDRQERPDQHHELQRLLPRWAPGVVLPSAPS